MRTRRAIAGAVLTVGLGTAAAAPAAIPVTAAVTHVVAAPAQPDMVYHQ
jgi:hypothetical protein